MPAQPEFDAVAAEMAMALFREGQRVCIERGSILVDTKYEFGKLADGQIVRHRRDPYARSASRFWYAGELARARWLATDPESFDKEYVRRFLVDQGYRGEGPIPVIPDDVRVEATRRYIEAVDRITGVPFAPNLEDSAASRMKKNLAALAGLPA